jgi:hypothetical protein
MLNTQPKQLLGHLLLALELPGNSIEVKVTYASHSFLNVIPRKVHFMKLTWLQEA